MAILDNLILISPAGAAVKLASGDQPADMKAMSVFMARTEPKTKKATELKTEWNVWFHDLSWYEMNFDRTSWMRARNMIAAFELANATNTAERESIERIQKQGAKLELEALAAKGKAAPINVETGMFEVDKSGSEFKWKWALLGATATVASGLGAHISPFGKVPLTLATMAGILGTGTYVAFKLED